MMSDLKSYVSRSCFVPGCSTGYVSDKEHRKGQGRQGETRISLFKAPKNADTLQKWQWAIPRSDKTIGPNNVVCALHFPAEQIELFYETRLMDGTIHKIKRGWPKLKKGAVPCIFPNLSPYWFEVETKQNIRTYISKKKKCFTPPDSVANTTLVDNKIRLAKSSDRKDMNIDLDVTSNNVTLTMFQNLRNSLDKISTPNKQWSGTYIPGKNEVVFAEWDDSYIPKKTIVLREDMSFKILIGKMEVKLEDKEDLINNFGELESLIESLEYKI